MASAANTADLIEAENALADRQAELDSLTAQQRYLSDQIDLSTLIVDISAEPRRPDDRDSFWDGGWSRAGTTCVPRSVIRSSRSGGSPSRGSCSSSSVRASST